MADLEEYTEVECIYLTLEDGSEMECAVVEKFEFENRQYIILAELDGEELVGDNLIYRYQEDGEELIVENIEDDDELRRATEAYEKLLDEE